VILNAKLRDPTELRHKEQISKRHIVGSAIDICDAQSKKEKLEK
jgi:hypothetical protein